MKHHSNFFEKVGIGVVGFFGFVVLLCIIGLLIGFPLMWLWNWLMPVLFGLKTITFWQSLGLFMLASLLIKGGSSSSNSSKS